MERAILVLLIMILGAGMVALLLDARQRRIDRQVAIAMPKMEQLSSISIRRSRAASRWRVAHWLVRYRPGLAYSLRWEWVALVGLLTAGADIYLGHFLRLPLPYILIGACAGSVLLMRALFGWLERRLASRLFRQLPDVIELVTSTVRSGLPVTEAFRVVARDMPQPTAGQFALVCNDVALGLPAEEALETVCERTGVAEYAIFAVALAIQTKSGGRLSETLQTLGDTIRQRVALAGRAKALAGEVIFSSKALSVSPVVIGGLLYLLNPSTLDLLFTDPTGRLMLGYAVASVIFGSLVIRWMINRETAV